MRETELMKTATIDLETLLLFNKDKSKSIKRQWDNCNQCSIEESNYCQELYLELSKVSANIDLIKAELKRRTRAGVI